MKNLALVLLVSLSQTSFAFASEGVCDAQALAFADQTFNNANAAQAKCAELIRQTDGEARDCVVQLLNNGQRRARFRKALNLKQQPLSEVLLQVQNFVFNNNIFGSKQIALQVNVGDGCGE